MYPTCSFPGACRGVALLVTLICATLPAQAATHKISKAADLSNLLTDASRLRPGDVIELADGLYTAPASRFVITVSGTQGKPITLKGSPSARLTAPGAYGLHLKASYWKLYGFTVEKSKKGIVLEGANNNLLDRLTVRQIDDEGIRLRSFSSRNVIRNSMISQTGMGVGRAPYGEAIYVGSALDDWSQNSGGQPDRSNGTCVQNNQLGPGISTEGIDVKEGTSGGRFIGNTYVLPSISKLSHSNGGDSFMDVKGDDNLIAGNRVSNAAKNIYLLAGIQVHQKTYGSQSFGKNNLFQNNRIDLNGTGNYAFEVDMPNAAQSGNRVCKDNVATNVKKGLVDPTTVLSVCLTPAVVPTCPDVTNLP